MFKGKIGLTLLLATSCAPTNDNGRVGTDSTSANEEAVAIPRQRYSTKDFASLRWIEGSWGGQMPNGAHFYEEYRFVDDSTIRMYGFDDASFAKPSDSASVVLRDGAVIDRGSTEWYATRLDSAAVEFTAAKGARNRFSWTRESAYRWTATLNPANGKTTVYKMSRIVRNDR